jgi:uncharacterized membrane protein YraQ (UPF0718 family)
MSVAAVHIGVITNRNLLANLRLPDVLILSTIQPVTFMLMFRFVFGGAIEYALPPAAQGEYINAHPRNHRPVSVFGSVPTAWGSTTTAPTQSGRAPPRSCTATTATTTSV